MKTYHCEPSGHDRAKIDTRGLLFNQKRVCQTCGDVLLANKEILTALGEDEVISRPWKVLLAPAFSMEIARHPSVKKPPCSSVIAISLYYKCHLACFVYSRLTPQEAVVFATITRCSKIPESWRFLEPYGTIGR
jgi:hypothetical protein